MELHAKRLLTQTGTLAAAALYREWADAVSKIYINVELLKRDVESALVKNAGYGLLWMSD
jgi:hypothetical protein